MREFFNILTVVSAILMVLFILLQQRASSLGEAFGGDNSFYRSRRGVELIIFQFTVFFAVIFVLSIVLGLLSN